MVPTIVKGGQGSCPCAVARSEVGGNGFSYGFFTLRTESLIMQPAVMFWEIFETECSFSQKITSREGMVFCQSDYLIIIQIVTLSFREFRFDFFLL